MAFESPWQFPQVDREAVCSTSEPPDTNNEKNKEQEEKDENVSEG